MKISAIGIGDAYSSSNVNASILVEADDFRVLIDCGPTVPFSLWKNYEKWFDIDVIYLTHIHPDHVLGLSMLINRMNSNGREKKLTILTHSENFEVLETLIEFGFWPAKDKSANSFIELISCDEKGSIGKFEYETVLTGHAVLNRAIKLEYNSKSVFISGDGILKEKTFVLLENTDVVIMECQSFHIPPLKGHSNFKVASDISKKFPSSCFYLYHIEDSSREKMIEQTVKLSNLSVLKADEEIQI